MIDIDALRNNLNNLKTLVAELGVSINISKLQVELSELEKKQEDPDIWSNVKEAQAVMQQAKRLSNRINSYKKLSSAIDENLELIAMIELLGEYDELDLVQSSYKELNAIAEKMRLETYLSGEYDACNAILAIHPGAGGTDSQDWAEMLYRMYTRYAEKKGFTCQLIDLLPGEEAGIKSVTFEVSGDMVYGYLKSERGVHRLIRMSPFNSDGLRHTSFASLDVMPIIEDNSIIEIKPEDLKIDTYRAGGAGGQHVNRTDSAVRITHIPTGIVTQCQNERSQIQNREVAMKMLRARLAERKEKENLERNKAIRGNMKKIEWGSQIRTYTFQPYTMVKDERTGMTTYNVDDVMDGDIDCFIDEYLKRSVSNE